MQELSGGPRPVANERNESLVGFLKHLGTSYGGQVQLEIDEFLGGLESDSDGDTTSPQTMPEQVGSRERSGTNETELVCPHIAAPNFNNDVHTVAGSIVTYSAIPIQQQQRVFANPPKMAKAKGYDSRLTCNTVLKRCNTKAYYPLPIPVSTSTAPQCFKTRPQTAFPSISPTVSGHNTLPAPSSHPIGLTPPKASSYSGAALIFPESTVVIATRRECHAVAASVSVIMFSAALDMLPCGLVGVEDDGDLAQPISENNSRIRMSGQKLFTLWAHMMSS
ncbi:hypothetical protein SNOG_02400 [Parastagonospora nodorum SN15]|uniref:Uncharacterized protein n=1 Tax=Phaeosphaeria nodorum (strain SN15 / ATCC MYA-4574 / FGSC 10173) TaxID=321614 RepID=Q0V0R4_PHANO|nr:hypothetical protein SNOG_02400 [Parastagonospora nodorum SN15]EAT90612.1 hypothetical protein SNOG_02400 [Parastagonospora nodorum SN15]